MNINEVLDNYVTQSNCLFTNTWEAIHALFPNIDIDFEIKIPDSRAGVVKYSDFFLTLPKGTEVRICRENDKDIYSDNHIYIYLPECANKDYWEEQIKLQNSKHYRFSIENQSIN